MLIALNKPYQVLSQFTDAGGRRALAEFVDVKNVYPAGRLDFDSEGLLLLTDEAPLAHLLTSKRAIEKTYLVQVDGAVTDAALDQLRSGLRLNDGPARALSAEQRSAPEWLWPRHPAIRFRASIPTSWIEIRIDEGRNRQVRRMTAAVGFPTLRLIRTLVGGVGLGNLAPGTWRVLSRAESLLVSPLRVFGGRRCS